MQAAIQFADRLIGQLLLNRGVGLRRDRAARGLDGHVGGAGAQTIGGGTLGGRNLFLGQPGAARDGFLGLNLRLCDQTLGLGPGVGDALFGLLRRLVRLGLIAVTQRVSLGAHPVRLVHFAISLDTQSVGGGTGVVVVVDYGGVPVVKKHI